MTYQVLLRIWNKGRTILEFCPTHYRPEITEILEGNAFKHCSTLFYIQTTYINTLKQSELVKLGKMPESTDIMGISVSSNKKQSQPHKQGLCTWGHPNITG